MKKRLFDWVAVPLVRGLTTLPLALATVLCAPFGLAGPLSRVRYAVAARFPVGGEVRRQGVSGALAAVPLGVVAFAMTAVGLFVTYTGYLYFLRPDAIPAIGHPFSADRIFDTAWGGPTLAGAWLVHSLVALGIQVVAVAVVRGCVAVQDRRVAS
ncbi:hypothetical protein [Actinokineospora sp. HUAS TT18]|uniref:hypothetical protein n=1 Tax=Actinokineospora sp. HUAS TT18 TaxID=3447451 RepID=UPI003F52093C